MDSEKFGQMMKERREEAERILQDYLPPVSGSQQTVLEAMAYSVLAGGKRLRPILMLESYRLFGGSGKVIEPFVAAIEMIHTYSLVHDDLPAMDNDKYRRGKLTTHAKYGEAMGILAGDGLLTYAFETAGAAFSMTDDPARVGRAIQVLARKAGIYGMLGGQVIDVESEGKPGMTLERITQIHTLKTAALMESSLMIGAILAGATEYQIGQMEQIARSVGIAFQIQDDILDVTSTQEVLGKPIGSDARNAKTTYVTLQGMDASVQEVKRLSREAVDTLRQIPGDTLFLEELIRMLTMRNN
ncbi:MAG: polyprenyl synthetase family protein [Lachnospiraceae bacterium]|nr:polyprenyl synthetase family protein [Lachnospiraceae bacterium]